MWPILLALGISLAVTNELRMGRTWLTVFDHPNARSLHSAPTPRTGGLAIMTALVLSYLVAAVGVHSADRGVVTDAGFFARGTETQGVVIAMALALAVVSYWDDRHGLSPTLRFICHIGASWATAVYVLKGGLAVILPAVGPVVVSPIATALAIAWGINLFNFMDGLDGLVGGVSVAGFVCLGTMCLVRSETSLALTFGLAAAAVGGFLTFNIPPAKIFMGDVGSVPIGYLAAVLSMVAIHRGVFPAAVPLMVFSPLVADATWTLIRRVLRRRAIWQAHREHFYQRAVLAGVSKSKVLALQYGLMVAACVAAWVYQLGTHAHQLAAAGIVAVLQLTYFAAVSLRERRGPQPRRQSAVH